MEQIQNKIKDLLRYNDIEPTYGSFGQKSDDPNDFDNIMKAQEDLMDELAVLAKAKNTLLGRTMRFPMADSYALYVVTKVNKNSAQVTWLRWCDAWQDDRLGYRGSLPLSYVSQHIRGRDALDAMFAKHKAEQQA